MDSEHRRYFVIDAFASEPFGGNPAAVVVDTDGLDDARMQAIAAEFNLSETTFVLPVTEEESPLSPASDVPVGLSVRFRWFTPTLEVDMCGHATVAGVQALVESGRLPFPDDAPSVAVQIDTRSGLLTAFVERIPGVDGGQMIWLDLIDPVLTPHPMVTADLATVLGLPVDAFDLDRLIEKTQDGDLIVFVRDVASLNDAKPDFAQLSDLLKRTKLRGLSLATVNTLTPSIHVQSRFFAPAVGVDEDPVTGSVHGPLAAYLVKHGLVPIQDGLAAVTCVQGKPGGRAGLLYALVQPQGDDRYAARIGGRAVTVMRGTLMV